MLPTFVRARILNDSYISDFEHLSKDYTEIVWALQRINHSLFEFKTGLKLWQEHLEILSNKFIQINFSLAHLIKGTPFPSLTTRKVTEVEKDMSSIYILIRAIIETYLTLYYLNFQVTDDTQGHFRNLLYKHSGLARRQSFHIQGKEGKLKLDSERLLIDELKKALQDNEYFKTLDKKKRDQLLGRMEAKEMSWTDLILSRGIKGTKFLTLWKLLSNHAHAEYLGTIQLKHQFDNPHDRSGIYALVSQPLTLVTLLIDDFLKAFKPAQLIFETFEEDLQTTINVYRELILNPNEPLLE